MIQQRQHSAQQKSGRHAPRRHNRAYDHGNRDSHDHRAKDARFRRIGASEFARHSVNYFIHELSEGFYMGVSQVANRKRR